MFIDGDEKSYDSSFRLFIPKAKRLGWGDDMRKAMNEGNVPDWFMDSCRKIDYLFTRAHLLAGRCFFMPFKEVENTWQTE